MDSRSPVRIAQLSSERDTVRTMDAPATGCGRSGRILVARCAWFSASIDTARIAGCSRQTKPRLGGGGVLLACLPPRISARTYSGGQASSQCPRRTAVPRQQAESSVPEVVANPRGTQELSAALSRYISQQKTYVDQSPGRLSGTNVRRCSVYLLTAAGGRINCARHGFPNILHRATSQILDNDKRATCVER